jgi:putative RNA 2'-phosphotransferase
MKAMSERFERLSRTIAHALRHRPERYGLELDKDGWTPLEALIAALTRDSQWASLRADDIHAMMAAAGKQRYEIRGSHIRAIYGHSLEAKIGHTPAVPPDRLFHGTTGTALAGIRLHGLRPMRRQYVHLSMDTAAAAEVAARRTATPVIVTVDAGAAHRDGVAFYCGGGKVWLAGGVAEKYLAFPALG